MSTLEALPDEILLTVLENLDSAPLLRPLLSVNRRFNIVAQDDALWETICNPLFEQLKHYELFKKPQKDYMNWYKDHMTIHRETRRLLDNPDREDFKRVTELGLRTVTKLKQLCQSQSLTSNWTTSLVSEELLKAHDIVNLWVKMDKIFANRPYQPFQTPQPHVLKTSARRLQMVSNVVLDRFAHLATHDEEERVERESRAVDLMNRVAPYEQDIDKEIEWETPLDPSAEPSPVIEMMMALDGFGWKSKSAVEELDKVYDMIKSEATVTAMSLHDFVAEKLLMLKVLPVDAQAAFRCGFLSAPYDQASALNLCCKYAYIAKKFGIRANPVVLPFKTLVRIDEPSGNCLFIDAERGGRPRTLQDIINLANFMRHEVPSGDDLQPSDVRRCAVVVLLETQAWLRNTNILERNQKVQAAFGLMCLKRTLDRSGDIPGAIKRSVDYMYEFMPYRSMALSTLLPQVFGCQINFQNVSYNPRPRLFAFNDTSRTFKLGQICARKLHTKDESGVVILGVYESETYYGCLLESATTDTVHMWSAAELQPLQAPPQGRMLGLISHLGKVEKFKQRFLGFDGVDRLIPSKFLRENYPDE